MSSCLLDELGLTLHGKAQADLLRYFEQEVQGKHQLIYSTASGLLVIWREHLLGIERPRVRVKAHTGGWG